MRSWCPNVFINFKFHYNGKFNEFIEKRKKKDRTVTRSEDNEDGDDDN